jgi:transposase
MAAAYSMDLRARVIQDADAGLSSKELAARYHVSRAWVDALKQRRRETGAIAPHKQTKFRRRVLEGQEDRLRALVTAQPDFHPGFSGDPFEGAYESLRIAPD